MEACSGTTSQCPADSFKAKGFVCRPPIGVCDLKENCTGTLATCPKDVYVINGAPCQNSTGTCQGGKCLPKSDAGVPDKGAVADLALEAGADQGKDGQDPAEAGAGKDKGSSTADTSAGADASVDQPPSDESGCDCRVGGDPDVSQLWLLLLGLLFLRRRP